MSGKQQKTERVPLCGDAPEMYKGQIYIFLEKEQKTIYAFIARESASSDLPETP